MIWKVMFLLLIIILLGACQKQEELPQVEADFDITAAKAQYNAALEQIEFQITVKGQAGATVPTPAGQLDGAPVLAYVFPTNLAPTAVGFGNTTGIVALALTSHPDFDDTPLWDENVDGNYENDGATWHPHWVLLEEDTRVEGGLSVKEFDPNDNTVILPPTNPGMPMYMDSPGYQVVTKGQTITVVVPTAFIQDNNTFNFDAVTARMQVNITASDKPLLGVYEVYEVLSGDLSLPYQVQ